MCVFACGASPEEWVNEQQSTSSSPEKPKPTVDLSQPFEKNIGDKPPARDSAIVSPSLAWTLSLTTSPLDGSAYPSSQTTVTAVTNHDVLPTPYYIKIYSYKGENHNYSSETALASCGAGTMCTIGATRVISGPGSAFHAEIVQADGTATQASAETTIGGGWGNPIAFIYQHKVPVGSPILVTAEVEKDVGTSIWYLQLYDVTTGTRIASCSTGKRCGAWVTESVATTHTFKAFVSPPTSAFPPPGALETSLEGYATWSDSPYTLSLTAPMFGDTFYAIPVTATANLDLSNSTFGIGIYRADTGEKIKTCYGGTTCTVDYSAPGDYYNFGPIAFIAFVERFVLNASSVTPATIELPGPGPYPPIHITRQIATSSNTATVWVQSPIQ